MAVTTGFLVRPPDNLSASGRPKAPPRDPDRGRDGFDRRALILTALVLGALVAGLVFAALPRATMAFGDSHDGRNAGVWAEGSRALREQGPVASRLGTRGVVAGEVKAYATHPPGIAVEAAAAESVLGERPWATRLPAWAGSLAAIVLAFLLLRACRLRPLAAAVGVALGFGCPMFATYGTMLDTPMVGLPFGIAVLWLWQRGRSGRPAPTPVVVLVSVLAALTSWLGLLTVGLVAMATLLSWARRRLKGTAERPDAAGEAPAGGFVVGAVLGTALVVLWIGWAYGSLGPLADQFLVRSGERSDLGGLGTFIATLRLFWGRVFTPWQLLLAIPALVAAVQLRRSRAVAVVLLVDMGIWIGGLRDGALHHDYWAYWMVLPLALGVGVMADAALTALQRREDGAEEDGRSEEDSTSGPDASRAGLGRVALAGCAAALALTGAVAASGPGRTLELGQDAGALLAVADYPSDQRQAWVLMPDPEVFSWVSYQTGLPMAALPPRDLEYVRTAAPHHLVLAAVSSGPPSGTVASAACLPPATIRGGYVLAPAAVLSRALRVGCS